MKASAFERTYNVCFIGLFTSVLLVNDIRQLVFIPVVHILFVLLIGINIPFSSLKQKYKINHEFLRKDTRQVVLRLDVKLKQKSQSWLYFLSQAGFNTRVGALHACFFVRKDRHYLNVFILLSNIEGFLNCLLNRSEKLEAFLLWFTLCSTDGSWENLHLSPFLQRPCLKKAQKIDFGSTPEKGRITKMHSFINW